MIQQRNEEPVCVPVVGAFQFYTLRHSTARLDGLFCLYQSVSLTILIYVCCTCNPVFGNVNGSVSVKF